MSSPRHTAMTHPRDRSALHLDLLAQRLAEQNPPHDLANIVGAAVHPAEVREVRGLEEADNVVTCYLLSRVGVLEMRIEPNDDDMTAIGDVIQRLVRSAVAFKFAGNESIARDQWLLASRFLGWVRHPIVDTSVNMDPGDLPIDKRHAECSQVAALFAKVGLSSTVHLDGADNTLRPVLKRAPTNDEMLAFITYARTDATRDLISRTRGLRSLHVNMAATTTVKREVGDGHILVTTPNDDDTVLLQFTVEGDEAP